MNLDSILATLVGSYSVNDEEPITLRDPSEKTKRAKRSAVPSDNGSSPKVVSKQPPPAVVELPTAGEINIETAKKYLIASRRATCRDDSIAAIAAFIGYDRSQDFGPQELHAKSEATKQIKPVVAGQDRKIRATVQGFVKGAPDYTARKIADLEGREALAAAAMIEQEKLAKVATTLETKFHHQTLAKLERERITSIQEELAALI